MMDKSVVITGIGMVVPLGMSPDNILGKLQEGVTAKQKPDFNTESFDCPFCASIHDFDAENYFPENKTLRFMNRDAQLAVVAAQMAMQDAGIVADKTYAGQEIALYGSTGVAGMSVDEAAGIVRHATGEDGTFDLQRFGSVALKRIRPVISFKILASMPICFVSIFQNVRGPNAIYSPWEGNGAHAIATGVRAIKRGDVPCALVGGCDVKTRELSFINLQQLGIFDSWKQNGVGCIPGEGSAFLVLEDKNAAAARGKKAYARITDYNLYSADLGSTSEMLSNAIGRLTLGSNQLHLVSACDGAPAIANMERESLEYCGIKCSSTMQPKSGMGDLFAAAAFVQVGLGAAFAKKTNHSGQILANCMGYGSEQAVFVMEAACGE
jgi:3-oxoacyl-(acyl-carrier-protein) synthase